MTPLSSPVIKKSPDPSNKGQIIILRIVEVCTALVLSRIYSDPEAEVPLPSIAIGRTHMDPVENPTIKAEAVVENKENETVPKSFNDVIFPKLAG
jgi:hypothetical protein